jgi:hypothetical protein
VPVPASVFGKTKSAPAEDSSRGRQADRFRIISFVAALVSRSVCRSLAVPTTAHFGAPDFELKASRTKQEFKNVIDAGPLNSAEAKLLLAGRV